jgi:hypothetical protein
MAAPTRGARRLCQFQKRGRDEKSLLIVADCLATAFLTSTNQADGTVGLVRIKRVAPQAARGCPVN